MTEWKGHSLEGSDVERHQISGRGTVLDVEESTSRPFEHKDRVLYDHVVWEIQAIERMGRVPQVGLVVKKLHEAFWASDSDETVEYECISDNAQDAAEEYAGYYGLEVGSTVYVYWERRGYRVDPLSASMLDMAVESTSETEQWHEDACDSRPTVADIETWIELNKKKIEELTESFNRSLGVDRYFCMEKCKEFQVVFTDPIRVEDPREAMKCRFGVEG